MEASGLSLGAGLALSGLTFNELWLRQLAIGGSLAEVELEAGVLGLLRLDAYQHDLIAQAINEHFIDNDGGHRVAYTDG
jgi:hypothetical protein